MNKIIKFVFATLPPVPASCSKSATAGEVEQPETYIYIRTHYLYTCVREAKGALSPLSPSTSPLRRSSSPLHDPTSPLLMSFHFLQVKHTA